MASGVYSIWNPNHSVYIGKSVDLHRRKREHKTRFLRGEGDHKILHKSFNKYGFESHQWIIEKEGLTTDEELNLWEQKIYDDYKREGLKMMNCYRPEPEKAVGSQSNHPWYGKKLSKEHKLKLSLAKKGAKHYNYGKKQSKERIRNRSLKNSIKVDQYDLKGNFIKTFNSKKEAAQFCNLLNSSHISQVCIGKRRTSGGYRWAHHGQPPHIIPKRTRKQSEETRQKLSKANKGKVLSKEHRKKISQANKGRVLSEQTKAKMKESLKIRFSSKEYCQKLAETKYKKVDQYTLDGLFIQSFDAVVIAEKITGVSKNGISRVCRGERKTSGGYRWAYHGQPLRMDENHLAKKNHNMLSNTVVI